MKNLFGKLHYGTLSNGLRIIVNTDHKVPKVSSQLWYAVGSKDEGSGQRGLAHLLEHMIFKGTDRLSESDINLITSKLSGYANAFTFYDYTGYIFDFPKQHWQMALNLFADCMVNCHFNEDMLQSELKAVVQELKLYKDDYASSLGEAMMSLMFPDHPYHHPIIGYKQDLWSITRAGLLDFYKQYYHPGNATLVVVGAVDHQEVMLQAQHYFGSIPAKETPVKKVRDAKQDVQTTSVTLYRDVQRPQLTYAWRVPGAHCKQAFATAVAAHIVGESKNSLLYQKLVDELNFATDVRMSYEDMLEHGALFLQIDPVDQMVIEDIQKEVQALLERLHGQGVRKDQVAAAANQVHLDFLVQTEDLQERAYIIGKGYMATGDPYYLDHYIQTDIDALVTQVNEFIRTHLPTSVINKGLILPLPASEKKYWLELQKESDRTDNIILSRKVRHTEIEPGRYVDRVMPKALVAFDIPRYKKYTLCNGLVLLHHPFTCGDKVEIQFDFDAQYYYDPQHLQGLGNFVFALLQEGTTHFSKQELIQALADRGMQLDISCAHISLSLLKKDLEFGLHLLYELLEHALFDNDAIEKIRQQILLDIADYWDNPGDFVKQLAREHIYQHHPYGQHVFGTPESVNRIIREDIVRYYKTRITPVHARMAIVGISDEIEQMADKALRSWSGSQIDLLQYPAIKPVQAQEIVHPIVRDQVTLAFAGPSVAYNDPLYNALSIFDQILTDGLSSHLFRLREKTGLFYSIGGSLVYGASKQPGMFYFKTMVSQDRLAEAQQAIKHTLQQSTVEFTDQEVAMAKNALVHQIIDQFATQKGVAGSFLFLEHMDLPADYFKERIDAIERIDRQTIAQAVRAIIEPANISTFKVGRVS